MGNNTSDQNYDFASEFELVGGQASNQGLFKLRSRQSGRYHLGRRLSSSDDYALEIDTVAMEKINNPSPFVTRLLQVQSCEQETQCSTQTVFHLLFEDVSWTLADEILERAESRRPFQSREVSSMVERVSKGLKYLYNMQSEHGYISSRSIAWPMLKGQQIQLIDPWACSNPQFLTKPSRSVCQSNDDAMMEKQQLQSNDLYNVGLISRQLLNAHPHLVSSSSGRDPNADLLPKKLEILCHPEPHKRLQIYKIIEMQALSGMGRPLSNTDKFKTASLVQGTTIHIEPQRQHSTNRGESFNHQLSSNIRTHPLELSPGPMPSLRRPPAEFMNTMTSMQQSVFHTTPNSLNPFMQSRQPTHNQIELLKSSKTALEAGFNQSIQRQANVSSTSGPTVQVTNSSHQVLKQIPLPSDAYKNRSSDLSLMPISASTLKPGPDRVSPSIGFTVLDTLLNSSDNPPPNTNHLQPSSQKKDGLNISSENRQSLNSFYNTFTQSQRCFASYQADSKEQFRNLSSKNSNTPYNYVSHLGLKNNESPLAQKNNDDLIPRGSTNINEPLKLSNNHSEFSILQPFQTPSTLHTYRSDNDNAYTSADFYKMIRISPTAKDKPATTNTKLDLRKQEPGKSDKHAIKQLTPIKLAASGETSSNEMKNCQAQEAGTSSSKDRPRGQTMPWEDRVIEQQENLHNEDLKQKIIQLERDRLVTPPQRRLEGGIMVIPEEAESGNSWGLDEDREFVIEQYQNGSKYEGYKSNGMRNGPGKFYYQEGSMYDGEWRKNNMHGYGRLYYANKKLAYEGEWYRDQFHGKGRVYNDEPAPCEGPFDYSNFQNLDEQWNNYEGTLVSDSKEGYGKLFLSNGEYYEGQFHNDNIHGQGKFHTLSGETVSGLWKNSQLLDKL